MPCFNASRPERSVRWILCACLIGAALPGSAQAQAPVVATPASSPALQQLLARFAAMSGLSAKFHEEKRMALLAAPLVNEGVLYFAPRGRLARHITAPAPATVLIDEGSLRYADAGGSESMSLNQNPVLRLFVESFVKIFAGDRAALERMYTLELVERPIGADAVAHWTLNLRPRIAPMTQIIERIEIVGHDVTLETMRVIEVGGDETITTFTEVDTQRRFTPQEQVTLFALPPRR